MLNHRLVHHALVLPSIALAVALQAGCADGQPVAPDGMPVVPIEAEGTYALRSSFTLAAPPPGAADVLAELTAATDGPDDPSRFLVDRLVAKLPEGRTQVIAAAVAPYIAAYLQQRIDTFAPDLATKLRMLADGVNQVARRFGTTETLTVDAAGNAQHVITGLGFGASGREVEIAFAPLGMSDVAMQTSVSVDSSSSAPEGVPSGSSTPPSGGSATATSISIASHAAMLPYGAVLRLGLDRLVVPRVVVGSLDLADAFVKVVNCDRVGAHVSEYVGVGSADLYAEACTVAVMRLAAEIYERLETPPVRFSIAGSAHVFDAGADGSIDAIADGVWTGTFAEAPLAPSFFGGDAR